MNSDTSPSALESRQSQGYVSPDSETRKSSGSSGKKRASRAGTRSVTTLSAAQLERKRANDREAQRAIRQRTKDHIDHLERSLNDLRGSQEANEKVVHATQQRNRELEDENVYLRNKLNEAGFNLTIPATEHQRLPETTLFGVPSTSPVTAGSAIQRPGSTSTPSSAAMSSSSRHGSWQHQSAGFVANTAMGLPSVATVANAPNLTTWRSHESAQSMQDPMQAQPSAPYHQADRVEWPGSAAPYGQYVSQEQQRGPQYETAPPQQQAGYHPAQVQGYGASAGHQPPTYNTQLTPQSEFPSISVSTGPSTYQVQSGPTFAQPASFQVSPMQVPSSGTEYTSPHGQMQPPPLPNASFHPAHGEQAYGPQQPGPLQYREENGRRSYSLSQYPTA